ncbi:hypothetical protein [Actinoplanes flavus]|uniref:PPE family protein n=1 Tax=Actinoplanes flavus TaxID=2820290 RepID=A0ABS3UNW6_9ACTN|nr:hypothetical protein [Actinoplanes flavus]MBO3740450.1 hypothetical protein [Actinoplanes flavus]
MAIEPGGGVSGTSWNGMSVDAMWELIRDHDSAPHREMGDAWFKSAQLLENHVSQVRSYRDRLAEAWPPEKSRAAYAYIERLEQLIISLEETRLASNTNWRVLTTTIEAVEQAKEKVAGIQKEYADNRDKLQKFEQAKNETALATMDPLPTTPPVPYSRQDDLTTQARLTMQSLSAELAAAQSNFIAPKPYSPRSGWDNNFDSFDSGGGASIPTGITPAFSPRSLTPTKASNPPISGAKKAPENPSNENTKQPQTPKPSAPGPILGEAKPQPPSPTTGLPTTPTTVSPTTNSPGPYTISPGIPSTSTTPPRLPVTTSPPVGTFPPGGTRGTIAPNSGILGGPSSGVIGGSPSGRGGQMGGSTRSTPKVNPVGGMIGQGTGSAAHPGRRSSTRQNEEASHRWDPDNPWETAEGTDPVLLPAQEQRIDPGPSIGGR